MTATVADAPVVRKLVTLDPGLTGVGIHMPYLDTRYVGRRGIRTVDGNAKARRIKSEAATSGSVHRESLNFCLARLVGHGFGRVSGGRCVDHAVLPGLTI